MFTSSTANRCSPGDACERVWLVAIPAHDRVKVEPEMPLVWPVCLGMLPRFVERHGRSDDLDALRFEMYGYGVPTDLRTLHGRGYPELSTLCARTHVGDAQEQHNHYNS